MDRLNRVLRNQVRPQPTSSRSLVPIVLPDWVEKGTSLVYISKSNGDAHSVRVEKIEERKQMVVIRFESNHKVWKRVPFMEIKKFGDGTLRPLWKKTEVPTVPTRPKNFIDAEPEKSPPMAEAVDPTDRAPEDEDLVILTEEPVSGAVEGPALGPTPQPEPAGEEVGPGSTGETASAGAARASEAAPEPQEATAAPTRGQPSRSRSRSAAKSDDRRGRDDSPEGRARAAAAAAATAALADMGRDKGKKSKKGSSKEKEQQQEQKDARRPGKRRSSSSSSAKTSPSRSRGQTSGAKNALKPPDSKRTEGREAETKRRRSPSSSPPARPPKSRRN